MITHDLIQGSPEWHEHRARHFNASDAPAMMGCSPYTTRTQLIKQLATGVFPEVDAATQRRFDDGHRFEALARPLAEEVIGEDLFPVTGTEGKYSASFDGLTMGEDVAFEHKSLNADLRAAMDTMDGSRLPLAYRVQMEQQCMVSCCAKVLFMATKWDEANQLTERREAWYTPDLELRAKLIDGWTQLEVDVAAYVPAEVTAPVVAAPVHTLPAVSVRLQGALTVVSNLPELGAALRIFIERMVPKPATDQQFADAEAECKALKKVEEALETGENAALAELTDVDAMRRAVADLRNLARSTRLAREKLVTAEKENRRLAIVTCGTTALRSHIDALNTRLGRPYMPTITADFGGAIKGKKNLDSMQDAVDTLLANTKLHANETADKIQANLTTLRELASAHTFLFADTSTIVLKAPDDLTALVKSRIADHQAAEAKKEEASRERIRKEEQTKAEAATAELNQARMSEIQGIQHQVMIATGGRVGVRKGGTIDCIRETLAETEAWPVTEENFGAMLAMAQGAKDRALEQIRALLADAEAAVAVPAPAAAPAIAQAPAATVTEDAPAPAAAAAPTPVAAPAVSTVHAFPAAAAKPVAPSAAPTLKLGSIKTLIAPLDITAEGMRALGFEGTKERGAVLYHEADLPHILAAMVAHLEAINAKQAA